MLSIVIPVYNGEKFIVETIKHIQSSTYEKFELIIVNDGSNDQSEEMISRIAVQDKRIKYFYKENGGIVSARNYGMQQATGKYICFVDQDDIVMPDMFETLIQDLEDNQADFAQGGVSQSLNFCVDKTEDIINLLKKGTKEYDESYAALILRGDVLQTTKKIDCNIWNKVYRLDFLRAHQINFYKYLDYEDDWIFVINVMRYARNITLRKKVVYIWRQNEESESRNRIIKDKYLDDFYKKHSALREFLLDALSEISLPDDYQAIYEGELQKETLLWGLSNETGRGISNRTIKQSTVVMQNIVKQEKCYGIKKGMLCRPLPVSIYGQYGIKKLYYIFRDILLTFFLLNHLELLAVVLNKKVMHGRWHN